MEHACPGVGQRAQPHSAGPIHTKLERRKMLRAWVNSTLISDTMSDSIKRRDMPAESRDTIRKLHETIGKVDLDRPTGLFLQRQILYMLARLQKEVGKSVRRWRRDMEEDGDQESYSEEIRTVVESDLDLLANPDILPGSSRGASIGTDQVPAYSRNYSPESDFHSAPVSKKKTSPVNGLKVDEQGQAHNIPTKPQETDGRVATKGQVLHEGIKRGGQVWLHTKSSLANFEPAYED
jgi:hypothetical protein